MDWGPAEYEPGLSSSKTDDKEIKTFWPSGFRMPLETNDIESYISYEMLIKIIWILERVCPVEAHKSPGGIPHGEKPVGLPYPAEKSSRWYGSLLTLRPAKSWLQEERSYLWCIYLELTDCWLVHASLSLCILWFLTPTTMASPGCLINNAESQAPTQTYGIRTRMLTFPDDL